MRKPKLMNVSEPLEQARVDQSSLALIESNEAVDRVANLKRVFQRHDGNGEIGGRVVSEL